MFIPAHVLPLRSSPRQVTECEQCFRRVDVRDLKRHKLHQCAERTVTCRHPTCGATPVENAIAERPSSTTIGMPPHVTHSY